MMTENVDQGDIQMVKDAKKMENVNRVIPTNPLNKYKLIHHSQSIGLKRRNAKIMIMKVCSCNNK